MIENVHMKAEGFHNRAVWQISQENKEFLPDSTIERMEKGVDQIEAKEYQEGSDVLGSYSFGEMGNRIEVFVKDEEQLESTMQHETNHFMSFNNEFALKEANGERVFRFSGVRESQYLRDESGRFCEVYDKNRAMNEGITQLYTNRQLEVLYPEKALELERQNGYQMATELAEAMEDVVGKEALQRAYFEGDVKGLATMIDERAGERSFERLSKCMDHITYSDEYSYRIEAMREAQSIIASMYEKGRKIA